jgi:predicted membrane chloride channel (bestrophin family)
MGLKQSTGLILKVLPWIVLVIVAKLVVHYLGYEVVPLNPIFSALIGANVFLLGFLISGVLADYKESEKLPGEVATTLHAIMDEVAFVGQKVSDREFTDQRTAYLLRLAEGVREWLHKRMKTRDLMALIDGLTGELVLLEKHTQPNYIARLKQEQNLLRKMVVRIHTIRETEFVSSGYFIATTTSWLLIAGLVFLKSEPFYESLFFVGIVTYLMLFLLQLIRDLDNPFGYYESGSYADVSLKPIDDAIDYFNRRVARS